MFEARLGQASLLKKILESLKDLVTDANFDCSATGIALQAMDSSHVSLVSMLLQAEGFENYRCDRGLQLGINLNSMAKILKCAGNDDSVTLKSKEEGDTVNFTFENPSTFLLVTSPYNWSLFFLPLEQSKLSEFELKLLEIDADALGIPDTEYQAVIKMPASEFQRICRDLTILGDTGSSRRMPSPFTYPHFSDHFSYKEGS